ncbi:MAG: DUF3967 domain-containing protein [Bacillus sp. (in: firmicutes)]|uniref:DUF3967 domain-containing protein n=1 Tax=Bacillus sp. TaxID=1409 RepID=UPI0039E6C4A0
MEKIEMLYTANEVYSRLGVSGSTLRKYSDVLEREGYEVKKNSRGRREYTEFDVVFIEKLVELSKQDGMTLEKAAKMIVKQCGITNKKEELQEEDPIPFHIQFHLHQQYSAMVEEIVKVQQQNLLEIEKRIGNCIDQRHKLIEDGMKAHKECEERIVNRLEQRDENLMRTIREIQDVKRILEQAAAKEQKNSWWKFWKS